MRLDELLDGDRALLHMERYVDEGTKTYSPFAATSEVAPGYQPRSDQPHFDLVTVHVPRARIALYQSGPASALRDLYVRGDEVVFAIHPEIWDGDAAHLDELRAFPRGESIRVAPTASTRTVLVLEPGLPSHFLKLHCPRRISRFVRHLRRKHVHNSIVAAGEVGELARRSDRFGYLRDALGVTFGDDERGWGFLVRERFPDPPGTGLLIPCFALFGGDLQHPHHPPLVVQLIQRLRVDPNAFLVDAIMVPVVESWARVAHERGILLESHGQNTLLEVDAHFRPRRIVHRDFDVWIDRDARLAAGLDMPFIDAQVGAGTSRARAPYYSLIYDRFVGHELFDYLLAAVARFLPCDRDGIRARVIEAFRRAFPDAGARFPARTMYYFSNEPGSDRTELVDLHARPEWR